MLIVTKLSEWERAKAMIQAYLAADADADIEIRVGRTSEGEPAVLVTIAGEHFSLLAHVANIIADVAEQAINLHPNIYRNSGIDNLILALRHGAKVAIPHPPGDTEL